MNNPAVPATLPEWLAHIERVHPRTIEMGLDRVAAVRDALELDLIDAGLLALDDGENDKGDKQLLVRCAFNDFHQMSAALEAKNLHAVSTEHEFVAGTHTELPEDKAEEVMKLIAALEDDDDVQNVYSNLG